MVFVADDADVAFGAREQANQFFLRSVGVLKFVHLNVAEALGPVRADLRIFAEEFYGAKEQIVEVERRGFSEDGFVFAIDGGGAFLECVEGLGGHFLVRDIAVLCVADALAKGAWSEFLFGELQILESEFDDAVLVVVIVDGKIARQAGVRSFAAQEARAKGVKSGDPNVGGVAAAGANKVGNALAHLVGGFVGESDGEDIAAGDALFDEVRDAIGDDARFAGAGPREDEHRAFGGEYGFALLRIESVGERHYGFGKFSSK